jgi:hypothetical protein
LEGTTADSSDRSQPQKRLSYPASTDADKAPDRRGDWPDDLCEIVYVDHYGNAMTGLRAAMLPPGARLTAAGRVLDREDLQRSAARRGFLV